MKNHPSAADLLKIARETLLAELRPLVPEEGRYTLAMIANAMAIAARDVQAGEASTAAALARLEAFYNAGSRELTGAALSEALMNRERELAGDIRRGRFDARDESRRALLEHLKATVEARLAISNPKSLTA